MSIFELKLLHNNKTYALPPWIKFAFGLGSFLSREGVKYNRHTNIAVSLPSDRFFAVFAACGIADKAFSERKQIRSIRKQILGLNPGSRVILTLSGQTKEVSVVSVEKNPYTDEMLLYVQDGSVKHGIPERLWMESIFLLDEEFDEIKRTRRVNKNLGITSPLINMLYTQTQLSKTPFFPGLEFYFIGNKSMTEELLSITCFKYGNVNGSSADFLYVEGLENNSSYTNGKFISSQTKRLTNDIDSNIPVIYSDIGGFRRLSGHFANNPSLILLSRTDHGNRILEAQAEISRKLVQRKAQFITRELIKDLKENHIPIPHSIEMIAWREK
ncbi:hypothetical protein [Paenibacillus dakarensis]|uniref:hypothetical protein n=1 Tax=Paenibacillus dakarensis TaxID=1527293 RepID=UPI0006D5753B|nr:hypothetical protein [Paenibacillus dakarensis]